MAAKSSNQTFNNEDNRFHERTINGNFKINLNKQNIAEIALIKYGYGVNQDLIFKVFDTMNSLLHGVNEYIKDNSINVPLVVVFYNSNHWSTLMVCKTKNTAYYVDYYKTNIPTVFQFNGIILHDSIFLQDVKYTYYESGIIALETAVTLFNNKEQLPFNNAEEFFNDILSWNSNYMIDKRKSFANCLQILQIQKNKLETLSNNVTKVLNQINHDKTFNVFSYSSGNVFLHFLETFALQDLRMNDIEPEYKRYLRNIINGEDIDRVGSLRSKLLLHRNNIKNKPDIINPNHLKLIINFNVSQNVNDFFQNISKYVNYILKITQGVYIDGKQIVRPHQFLVEDILKVGDDVESDEYNMEIDSQLEKFFTKAFSSPSYSHDKQKHDEEQQCIFDLIVNFAPYFDNAYNKRKEILKEMRNIQIHEFYRYSDENFAIEYALTNYLRENKNSLFKYCYSRYVYPLLRDFNNALEKKKNNKENIEKIKKELCDSLKSFLDIHRIKISRQQSVQNQITCTDSQNKGHQNTLDAFTCQTVSKNDTNIKKIKLNVEEYFKLLLFIANEVTKDKTDADNEDETIIKRYKTLKVEQILKIKTDLMDLQRLRQFAQPGFDDDYVTIKKSLQQQFKTDYDIMREDFDFIVTLTIKWDDIQIDDYDRYINYICNIIEIINKQQNEYKCSVKDILKMYRERRDLTFSKGSLGEKISSLPLTNICEVHISSPISQCKITRQLNPDRFVEIIYEIIYNESQKPISNNIDEVFNDDEFLDYLGKQDIFFSYLMKECLDFMIPLYARIISLPNYSISIKDLGLCDTIKKLVNEDYIIHLKPIVKKVCNKKGNQNIKTKFMEIICSRILENYNTTKNIEYLDKILGSAEIANNIIGIYLGMPEDSNLNVVIAKILDTLVGTSFAIACDFKDYNRGLELLTKESNINKAVAKLEYIAPDLYCSVKLNIARFHYKTGKSRECIQILKDMLNTATTQEVKPFYFLSMSYMAKIQNKVGQYEEAYSNYHTLYREFVEYILSDIPTEFNINVYKEIVNNQKYKAAQEVSSKYLDIIRIRNDMAYSKSRISNNNEQNLKDALNIYEEILKIQCDQADNFHDQIIKTKRSIGYVYFLLGIKMDNEHHCDKALSYYFQALTYNKDVFNLQKEKYWETHPAVKSSFKNILNTYKKIFNINIQKETVNECLRFVNSNINNIKLRSTELEKHTLNNIIGEIRKYKSMLDK